MQASSNTPTSAAITVAMIGSPVAHTHLPTAFNRWFSGKGLDAIMVPVDLEAARLADFLNTLRGWKNCRGCVVTAPHKQAVADHVDQKSDMAQTLGTVNLVVRNDDGSLSGDNLDGAGFVRALHAKSFRTSNTDAALFGCGGAGASIALALAEAGASRLQLVDKESDRASLLASKLEQYSGLSVEVGAPESLAGFELVINATAVGLDGQSRVFPTDTFNPDSTIADVLATSTPTPWLSDASARGCKIQTGADMAEGQFELIADRFGWAGELQTRP